MTVATTGQPVARFTVASTPRYLDKASNEWKDGDSLFLTCNVWWQAAENVAESLSKGMRVIVNGRLRQRSYEAKDGIKRTVYEVEGRDPVWRMCRTCQQDCAARLTGCAAPDVSQPGQQTRSETRRES